ncbi:MAG: formyltetrahydrofolate deformylase [Planctomycetota bacterium]|nr:formyltetrahydrofolate deformylase [Planctomycetota bacterium]
MKTHILSIDCPDQKGIVHHITGVLFRHGLNVVSNGEHVDHEAGRFFMRTEFEGEQAQLPSLGELKSVLPAEHNLRLVEKRKKNIVIMVSKEPHCLGDLLIRHAFDALQANILAVVGNHDRLQPLVEKFGIPYHFITHEGKERAQHEAEIMQVLDGYAPEYVVLAKYMRVLSEAVVARYKHRMVNIHHSFLPAFIGANPYRQAYERGVKIIGATAHLVTTDLDEGPIIAQSVIPVDHTHSARDMSQAGADVEKNVLSKALKLVLDDRVHVHGNRTVIFD